LNLYYAIPDAPPANLRRMLIVPEGVITRGRVPTMCADLNRVRAAKIPRDLGGLGGVRDLACRRFFAVTDPAEASGAALSVARSASFI
jgi:hypothetical protein